MTKSKPTTLQVSAPTTIQFCPFSGQPQRMNERAVVSVSKLRLQAEQAAGFERAAVIFQYDGLFYVTIDAPAWGYICTKRCTC